jgi:hypothetical protein
VVGVRQRLAAGDPLDFLAFASSIVANLDPRRKDPFEPARSREQNELTMPEFVESLARLPSSCGHTSGSATPNAVSGLP